MVQTECFYPAWGDLRESLVKDNKIAMNDKLCTLKSTVGPFPMSHVVLRGIRLLLHEATVVK